MACLSALAEDPNRLRKLFECNETSKYGIYGVKITKNGRPISVVLDEWIPTRNGRPAFAGANGPIIWSIMFEKAWAKIHGSYEKIVCGEMHLTFRDLTGAPSYNYTIKVEGQDKI